MSLDSGREKKKERSKEKKEKKRKKRRGKNAKLKLQERMIEQGWVIGETTDIENFYSMAERIGSPGSYGYCVMGTHKESGEARAVKIISKANLSRAEYISLRTEIKVMRRLRHKHIIKLYDAFETQSTLYLVIELCKGGELFDQISSRGQFSERDAQHVLRQIAAGLAYMHGNNIAHCDLKPDNFMFSDETEDATLKIIDFGMSKFCKTRELLTDVSGTAYYIAPEVLQGRYTKHCDMWSLGVVMFIMLFGFPPFDAEDLNGDLIVQQLAKGFDPTVRPGKGAWFPQNVPCSSIARDLIQQCLTMNHTDRISAQEFLDHPFLTGEASDQPRFAILRDLGAFRKALRFKKAVLTSLANDLTEVEAAELKRHFNSLDPNGTGRVTVAQLTNAMRAASARSRRSVESYVGQMQPEEKNSLNYDELVMIESYRKLIAKEERLHQAFCKLDTNNDGKVTPAEIQGVLSLTAEEAEEIMSEVETTPAGMSYKQFLTVWGQKTRRKIRKKAKRPKKTEKNSTLRVDSRLGRASMGMKLNEDDEGYLYVELIQDNLPAARAGIRQGDFVRKLNGEYVLDLADFIQIARRDFVPGANVIIELKRSMQVFSLTVTL